MAPSLTHVSGTVTSNVECRFTESGIAVCRFRLTEVPSQWDATTRQWRDQAPISYLCTAWRDLARNATESLTTGVTVLVKGRITEIKDNSIHLSVDDLGLSLRQRIAYTEASLPGPAAAAPVTPPPTPQPAPPSAPRPAAKGPGHPPAWWEERRSSGWSSSTSATDDPPLHVGR
ncbi:single-stranded DNA-binding protein [Streptomyces brasiliensis]|uniref:Single-stranded DNA-binding protein n=1 Tax=Streptomyces brasiliensis TaxID=1954 RepID=A0A917P9T2_9ACTN|nr:single-stranded DNA-binding protein [Streptomyces brasiliensis]GGJ67941.1 hypothetical protein GCM10010121_093270 [Streptomyces brasiliensis]